MKTLNVIGCGRVGKTLARLWTVRRVFLVRSVLNVSRESGQRAVDFVGAGRAVSEVGQMEKADLVMISAPDDAIEACCRQLARTQLVGEGVIVFHCSGCLPSTVLDSARQRGARVASAHPVKSFVDPPTAVETFAGTSCALEGDAQACDVLRDALERIGAVTFSVAPELKAIYHAATVFVCNYLVALAEVGLRCFEKAGVDRQTAVKVAEPLVRGTVDNLFRLGPIRALTGPIARGEVSVVARQSEALGQWDQTIQQVYAALGRICVDLSAAQGSAKEDALRRIEEMLSDGMSGILSTTPASDRS